MTAVATYVGVCCREWVLAVGVSGSCGLCGGVPVFVRPGPVVGEEAPR